MTDRAVSVSTSGHCALAPLDGIRVVDFGHYVAGPVAGMLLADQGARVVHIEAPGRQAAQLPAAAIWNRGKEPRVLNLKDRGDRDIAWRLIADADVVIENFRPGVMDRLGCGPEAMMARNPRLIYCSIPGFAAGDHRSTLAAWEGIVAAASGMYRLLSSGAEPAFTTIPIASVYGAVIAALNVAVALVARERTGRGARIEVPLFRAMLSGMSSSRIRTPRGRLALSRHRPGVAHGPTPFNASYRCRDGRYLYLLTGDHRKFANVLTSVLGVRDDPALALRERDPWLGVDDRNINDPSFLSASIEADLHSRLADIFSRRAADEWEARLVAAGVPAAVCRSPAEWFRSAHPLDAGLVTTDPRSHAAVCLGRLVSTHVRRPLTAGAGAISTNASRRQRIARGGRDARAAGPLAGIRVLDLSSVIAGPVCARTLGEFGADVIKIDSPRPNHNPLFTCALGVNVNRGKRSALLDLKPPAGRRVLCRLASTADVLVENFSAAAAAALDLGGTRDDDCPIHCRLNAFGFEGDWAGRKGYDPVVQAAAGIQARFGGSAAPRVHGHASTLDYLSGFAAAFGVVIVLFHRARRESNVNGAGLDTYLVETSLAHAASLVQSDILPACCDGSLSEPMGPGVRGWSPLDRLYRCSDGWLYVACPTLERQQFLRLPPFENLQRQPDESAENALERRFAANGVTWWETHLARFGVAAHEVLTTAEIRDRSLAAQDGLFTTLDVPRLGDVELLTSAGCVCGVAPDEPAVAPKLGAHTREILSELGVPRREARHLFAAGVVSESLGDEYVP
jgi:crotonobetainyl-CoA:carnitine CoA-transferase CaiB-like acyl-CoA transferase